MEGKIMKKLGFSLSRWSSGIAVLFLICSISNSCTKTLSDQPDTPSPSGPGGYYVLVGGGYYPAELKISVGDMITWTIDGSAIESITSDDGLFDGIVSANESYSFKFLSVGTYPYHSRVHSNLIGKVVVN
jgi:hypothetical protein